MHCSAISLHDPTVKLVLLSTLILGLAVGPAVVERRNRTAALDDNGPRFILDGWDDFPRLGGVFGLVDSILLLVAVLIFVGWALDEGGHLLD